jgi:hypothetical protein
MENPDYFDMRNLAPPNGDPDTCPVSGCAAILGTADSQWGEMPYCPTHRIRIHGGSRTFVYYNGSNSVSKRAAALRNIVFEPSYFGKHILGHAAKAETHRICHETSEDALTWNVFSQLMTFGVLPSLLSSLTGLSTETEPELYLWGLRIRLHESEAPTTFPALQEARNTFERGITNYLTEPDIMLYVPRHVLLLIEAKFASGNTIAVKTTSQDVTGEKPKSLEGVLRRYASPELQSIMQSAGSTTTPFYSQLYRNLVFAIHMADKLAVPWGLANLVSQMQFEKQKSKAEFQNPTQFICDLLPSKLRNSFSFYSWEQLYADHVAKTAALTDLAAYMYNKSANGVRALGV